MIKNEKFYSRFNKEEHLLLENYFNKLYGSISLPLKETKFFVEDFEKAILYYYLKKDMPLDKILKLLSLDNLGICYKNNINNWYPLDNAAKIYPLSMRASWMSVFRLSYYLKEDVVPELFQIALTFSMKRFPTFRTSIRRGFFWHYIENIKKRFCVYKDKRTPCSYINVSTLGNQSFKAVYYKNRISIEYFHILTDGYGGIVFLSTVVNEYLRLLGKKVTYNDVFLNIKEDPTTEELKDEFTTKERNKKTRSLVDSKALEIDGKLSNVRPCQLLHFDMDLSKLKEVCKEKNATISELMLAFIFLCCSYSTSKNGYIKIQVPVNMRKYFSSKTLRNFSLYIVLSIKKDRIKNIDDVLEEIKIQMKEKNTQKRLDETMSYTNKLVNSLKFIPLFIKKPIAYFVYGYLGDKVITTVFSNLGSVNLSDGIKDYIEKMDISLGTGITNRVLFSMISTNDIVTLTITKFTLNSSIENSMYNLMNQYGLNPKIYGSDIYGNKK